MKKHIVTEKSIKDYVFLIQAKYLAKESLKPFCQLLWSSESALLEDD